jgi:hypothetical protein
MIRLDSVPINLERGGISVPCNVSLSGTLASSCRLGVIRYCLVNVRSISQVTLLAKSMRKDVPSTSNGLRDGFSSPPFPLGGDTWCGTGQYCTRTYAFRSLDFEKG